MSTLSSVEDTFVTRGRKSALYGRMALLAVAATVICIAIINYQSVQPVDDLSHPLTSQLVRAFYSFVPYMISAVVAIITVIAIGVMIPAAQRSDVTPQLAYHLKMVAAGNLSTRMRVEGDANARELATDYNQAVTTLSHQLAALKIINRRQWEALCEIRLAVAKRDEPSALIYISEMEKNWGKIAEIENRLTT